MLPSAPSVPSVLVSLVSMRSTGRPRGRLPRSRVRTAGPATSARMRTALCGVVLRHRMRRLRWVHSADDLSSSMLAPCRCAGVKEPDRTRHIAATVLWTARSAVALFSAYVSRNTMPFEGRRLPRDACRLQIRSSHGATHTQIRYMRASSRRT